MYILCTIYIYVYTCVYWVANMIFSILIVHVRDCPLPDPAAAGARHVDPGEVERTGLLAVDCSSQDSATGMNPGSLSPNFYGSTR